MRLSEAIRWGARRAPQARHRLHERRTGSTCALGAAAAALGAWDDDLPIDRRSVRERLRELFPVLRATLGPGGETVEQAIAGLNDRSAWSRERIASRVAEWERALGFAAAPRSKPAQKRGKALAA
jgi:hypothetical protein